MPSTFPLDRAVYGMERMMGRADNPLRRILNYASEKFIEGTIPVVYVLTVIGTDSKTGKDVPRGLYIGPDKSVSSKPRSSHARLTSICCQSRSNTLSFTSILPSFTAHGLETRQYIDREWQLRQAESLSLSHQGFTCSARMSVSMRLSENMDTAPRPR